MWQTTDSVLMIRPAAFGSNPETAGTNAFQQPGVVPPVRAEERALDEFDGAVRVIEAAGVRACVVDDTAPPRRHDAVFPNNWITTHEDGTVVLYPMHAPSRRNEVRRDVVDILQERYGYRVERVVDLTPWADQGVFLEGTGSMVLDRVSRTAFACRSPRTSREVLDAFCDELSYAPFLFDAVDTDGVPIYHTNVQMWIGTQVAAVCADAVRDIAQREALLERLGHGGRTVIELTQAQVAAFAGNALELRAADTHPVLALSASAADALTGPQRTTVEAYARLAIADINAIEICSGGSLRCMLAEIFLPR